jgi:hypothetical protein
MKFNRDILNIHLEKGAVSVKGIDNQGSSLELMKGNLKFRIIRKIASTNSGSKGVSC